MIIEINDILSLSDKNEYVVVKKTCYHNVTYYYIADIYNPKNIKFCYIENDELIEIKDSQLILTLIAKFKDNNIQ